VLDQNTRTERVAGKKELLKIGTILLPERKRLEVREEKRKTCWTKCGAKNGPSAARTATAKTVGARHRRRTRCGYQRGSPSGADAGRGAVDEGALG
jgi:hypothetical protein